MKVAGRNTFDTLEVFEDVILSISKPKSINGDHTPTPYRVLVLPEQSPWLLGTILDGSPLRYRIPASWHSLCRPRKDDRQSQPHLVLSQRPSGT